MKVLAKLIAVAFLCMSFCAGAAQAPMPTAAHGSGPDFIGWNNAAFAAVSSLQSGSGDPGTNGGAYSFWADTGNTLLKQRNAANTAWVTIAPLLSTPTNASNLTSGTVPTARLPSANTSAAGIVQLNGSTSSTSTTQAATASAVKSAYDLANTANSNASTATTRTATYVQSVIAVNLATSTFYSGGGWSMSIAGTGHLHGTGGPTRNVNPGAVCSGSNSTFGTPEPANAVLSSSGTVIDIYVFTTGGSADNGYVSCIITN